MLARLLLSSATIYLCVGYVVGLGVLKTVASDPVLASGIQTERGTDPDRLRFNLAGEGALNDATSWPFVILGLALLSQHDGISFSFWNWVVFDLMWARFFEGGC